MEAPTIHFDHLLGSNPTWRALVTQALQGHLGSFLSELNAVSHVSPAAVRMLTASHEYARCGQQVFVIGPRLQRMFADTAATQVPAQFLRVPHECFYVATPGSSWELYGDAHTGMHQLGGFYIHQTDADHLVFVMWGKENERSRTVGDDAIFWLSFALHEIPRTIDEAGTVLLDIDAYMDTIFRDAHRDATDLTLDIPPEGKEASLRHIPAIVRTGINLILYLNSIKTETECDESRKVAYEKRKRELKVEVGRIKNPDKRTRRAKHALRELERLSAATIVWIGRGIEDAPAPAAEPTGVQRMIKGGTWRDRRGHFHAYWIGRRKNPDGTWRTDALGRRIGEKLVLKWIKPIHRDLAAIIMSRGRQYRFLTEKPDWKEK